MENFVFSPSQPLKGSYSSYLIDHRTVGANIVCPNCGNIVSLSRHRIPDTGRVVPSVKCSTVGCSFHDMIHLEGWSQISHKMLNGGQ